MRLAIALLVAVVPAVAAADPLALSAATHGSALDLTFTNTSAKPITMTTHVRAGLVHYDWLTVKLAGKTPRTLHFIETRTKAIPVDETIAAGGSLTKSVDLVLWAIHGEPAGDPLAPGTYDVEATWDTTSGGATGPKLKLTAKTTLTIAAPIETGCKDAGKKGIELLAHQVGKTSTIEVGLHNIDTVKHCVYGYIKTHEIQSDWLTITLQDKTPHKLAFDDARNKSYPVAIEIPPGATAWTSWDVAAWAKRKRNGSLPITGTVWAEATFDASRERDVWSGVIKTSLGIRLP